MRSLLDVNVLIAFLDSDHLFHTKSFEWFQANQDTGWATCPITENAALRILSHPGYSKVKRFQLPKIVGQLNEIIEKTNHQFWPDDISLLDTSLVETAKILGPGQLTDIYLLAIAVKHSGCLVSFDERIETSAVMVASPENLVTIKV